MDATTEFAVHTGDRCTAMEVAGAAATRPTTDRAA